MTFTYFHKIIISSAESWVWHAQKLRPQGLFSAPLSVTWKVSDVSNMEIKNTDIKITEDKSSL